MKKLPLFIFILLTIIIKLPVFAQNAKDTTKGNFRDDFLDHLVGKWSVVSVAHNFKSTAVIEAKWVLNHQFLYYHFKGNEVIPWIHVPMEFECYISYNYNNKRYVILGMSVFGVDNFEGFSYGFREGNELKVIQHSNNSTDPINIQRYIWQPSSGSWIIQSRYEIPFPQIMDRRPPYLLMGWAESFTNAKLNANKISSEWGDSF